MHHRLRPFTPLVLQRSRQARAIQGASVEAPMAGIYFVVRYPTGWVPLTWAYEAGFPQMDHPEFWEYHVAPILEAKWATVKKTTPERLEQRLRLHTYAFPRGRITILGGQPRVLHGSDSIPKMHFSRTLVQPLWEDDEHEHCQEDDKETVRRLLGIREDWPAV